MKVLTVIELYNDQGFRVYEGDSISITTAKGEYKGIIKSIKPKLIGVKLVNGESIGILYKDILTLI